MNGIESRLDQLADKLVERFFDKLAARFAGEEVEVLLPPSGGVPARQPRAPKKVKPGPKRVKLLPPAPAPSTPGTRASLMIDSVVKLMAHEDPGNAGIKAMQLQKMLMAKQKLSQVQAKARVARAKNAGAIRLEGRTAAATYFRT